MCAPHITLDCLPCLWQTRKPCCRRESARCRCNFRSI